MKCYITYDNDKGICIARVSGPHNRLKESRKLFANAVKFGAQYSCSLFLFDMREATIIGGPLEAFYTVSNPEEMGHMRHFRAAAVYSSNVEQHKFMETVARNRGHNFRVFEDIDEAIEYLTSK